MVRKIQRVFGKLLVLPAAVSIGFGGSASLLAQERPTIPIQRLAAAAKVPDDVAGYRAKLLAAQNSKHPREARIAKRTLLWLDIATAGSAAERSVMIKQLGVTVVRLEATDGRAGTVTSYSIGGRTRLQTFTPTAPASPTATAPELDHAEGASGPSVTGRWKDYGEDGCNWDPNDDGPDQCGPPTEICDVDGQPGECSTQQEMEDATIEVVAAEYDAEVYLAEVEEMEAQEQQYCYNYPWMCEDLATEASRPRGPNAEGSVFGPCTDKATNAVQNGSVTILAAFGYCGAVSSAAAATLSKVTRRSLAGAVVVGAFWTGYWAGNYVACLGDLPPGAPLVANDHQLYRRMGCHS